MKVSLSWVKEHTSIDLDTPELIRRIGAQLGAIEEVIDWGGFYDDAIVIAEITIANDHPDADKLGVYTISIGNETRELVAGDKTLSVGDKVAYIPPGARVPLSIKEGDPFVIEARELRGVTSQGMLGSGKELVLSDSHQGVQVFPEDTVVGTPLKQLYGLDDTIIDIENKMFTHRPDCFGILGVARELAGIQGKPFKSSNAWLDEAKNSFDITGETLELQVENQIPQLVPRITAIAMSGVTVKPSPLSMQSYLFRVGMRPINNVVDITNYVMHLTAQPAHAFDYDKVAAVDNAKTATIVARTAKEGEKITALDGRELTLTDQNILICSATKPIAVGGSIGGAETEVDEETKNIILEVANFDLYSIRRTSFGLGIFTDAVSRFNKGQSPEQCDRASQMAVELLQTNAGATIASQRHDIYEQKYTNETIVTDASFINKRLGTDFSAEEIATILTNTEFSVSIDGDAISVTAPFWRTDISYPEDIVEEVGRLHGFDNVPIDLPLRVMSPQNRSAMLSYKDTLRSIMSSAGVQEVLTYNFVSEKLFHGIGATDQMQDAYHIRNSLSPELQYMRQSILPSILGKVNQNIRNGYDHVRLFEVNKSHNKKELEGELPAERTSLACVVAANDSFAKKNMQGAAFYQARRVFDELMVSLGVSNHEYKAPDQPSNPWQEQLQAVLQAERFAEVRVEDQLLGYIGEISGPATAHTKAPDYCAGFEIDVAVLKSLQAQSSYQPLSKYPATQQDITLSATQGEDYASVFALLSAAVQDQQTDMQIRIEPLSVYQKDAEKRYAYRLHMQSTSKTLVTKEVNKVIEAIVKALAAKNLQQI